MENVAFSLGEPLEGPLVPAAAGTFLLEPCIGREGALEFFVKRSVLSWFVTPRATTAVTIHGLDEHASAILMPDGHVEDFAIGVWESVDDYTAEMVERHRKDRGAASKALA